jgi:hypothetical protein
MLSEELLNEVLASELQNEPVKEIRIEDKDSDSPYIYFRNNLVGADMSIYELAHKCKEWARNEDFLVLSYYTKNEAICTIERIEKKHIPIIGKTIYISATEPESIFNACELIMENKNV